MAPKAVLAAPAALLFAPVLASAQNEIVHAIYASMEPSFRGEYDMLLSRLAHAMTDPGSDKANKTLQQFKVFS
jgi:hypothetical protein